MLRAVKIKIYLDNNQIDYVNNLLGTCRFVYNNLLNYKIAQYNTNKHTVSFGEWGRFSNRINSRFNFNYTSFYYENVFK
jgi:transposase